MDEIQERQRALVDQLKEHGGFYSDACPWVMAMNYVPVMNLKTAGNSNYCGD